MAAGDVRMGFGSIDTAQNGAEFILTGTNLAGAHTLHTAVNTVGFIDIITIEAKVIGAPGHDPVLTLVLPDTTTGYVEMKVNLLENGGPRVVLDTWAVRGGLIVKAYTSDNGKIAVKVDVSHFQEG